MIPRYRILADGSPVSAGFNDRMTDLTITDHEGMQADDLKITFDDRDFACTPPRKGSKLTVFIDDGRGAGFVLMGVFTVTGRKRSFKKTEGRVLTVHGRSADVRQEMKQPRTGAHQDTDLEGVAGKIAGRYGLGVKVSPKLGKLKLPYLDQAEESDLHLLSRLARDFDAVFKVANGTVLFLARDEVESTIALAMTDFIDCSVDDDDRAQHSKSTAHHHDRGKVERTPETYGADDGSEGPESMLRHTFPTRELAQAAAKGRQSRLERMETRLHGVLTGHTGVMAGMVATIAWGVEMYDGAHALKTVTHHLKKGQAGGYTTTIDSHKGKGKKGGRGKAG